MDQFLRDQSSGELVDTQNQFTVDRGRSREKILASIPTGNFSSVFRLFDSAAWQLGGRPGSSVYESFGGADYQQNSQFYFCLPRMTNKDLIRYLDELKRPFGARSGASTLARATYRAVNSFSLVRVHFGMTPMSYLQPGIKLKQGSFEISDSLSIGDTQGVRIVMTPSSTQDFKVHRTSVCRRVFHMTESHEAVVPLESGAKQVSGFFDYRSKPFTAIRSYVTHPEDAPGPSMLLDLWKGPYEARGRHTVILNKKERGKFLFLRWRPNYGRPTFIHHFLDSPLRFGKQKIRATFWVETSDRPAHIYFFTGGTVSDPVGVKGPVGLTGMVIWPDLKFDLWGTRLVEDKIYQEALEWSQNQVDGVAEELDSNLNRVVERLCCSNLIKESYLEETIQKIRSYWGR